MGNCNLTERWKDTICSFNPSGEMYDLSLLVNFLAYKNHLERHYLCAPVMEKLRIFWDKQLQRYVNDGVCNLIDSFLNVERKDAAITRELQKIVNFLCDNPILSASPTRDVKEDVTFCLAILLLFCRNMDAKQLGIRVIRRYTTNPANRFLSHDINTVVPVDWLRLFLHWRR